MSRWDDALPDPRWLPFFGRQPRESWPLSEEAVTATVTRMQAIAKHTGATLQEVIQTCHMMEYQRRTDVMLDNSEARDRQIAGIGVALIEHAKAVDGLAQEVREFTRGDSIGAVGTSGVELLGEAIKHVGEAVAEAIKEHE